MTGINGNPETDKVYFENCAKLFPNVPLLQYKNIFGESYTAPALGVYAAAVCLQKGKIPEHLKIPICDYPICDYQMCDYQICDMRRSEIGKSEIGKSENRKIGKILCYNHFENKNHTFILLSK